MPDERKYSRVYHDAVEDPRFSGIWTSDPCLALWLRLLLVADGTWPAPAPVPRSTKARPLALLVESGLVELVSGDHFRIHGMTAERSRRSKQAAHAADVRWHSDSNADGIAPSIAGPMPSKAKTRQVETSIAREFKDPLLNEIRAAQVALYGNGSDTPIVVQPTPIPTAAEQEREAIRLEALALHERFLNGEIGPAEYERLRADIGKQPDDLTRVEA